MKKLLFAVVALASILGAQESKKPKTGEPVLSARTVSYRFGTAVPIYTQRHWSTIIYLDKNEIILGVIMADNDNFEVHAEKNTNFVSVNTKAESRIGSITNISLRTTSGNIYSAAIYDVTNNPEGHADTQVNFDASGDQEMKAAINAPPKFVPASELEAAKQSLLAAQKKIDDDRLLQAAHEKETEAKLSAQYDVAHDKATREVRSGYRFSKAKGEPFDVFSMTDNGKFTYIKTTSKEAFAVYEVKDGKPSAVNMFPDAEGTLRLDHIVSKGYFKVGKKQANFAREEE